MYEVYREQFAPRLKLNWVISVMHEITELDLIVSAPGPSTSHSTQRVSK